MNTYLLSELKAIDFTYFYFIFYFYFILFSISSILELSVMVMCDATVMLSHISHSRMIMCHYGRA